jgi:hypothetical protein
MIVLIEDTRAGICPRRVGPADRLLERLRGSRLDRQLARGASPDSTVALALHARRLVRPSTRRDLAHALERIMADATRPLRPPSLCIPLCRDRVLDARDELRAMAGRLLSGGPISARGVARVRILLSDGCGPLYWGGAHDDLRSELREALAALD